MFYENELRLFKNAFAKCHIETFIVSIDDKIDARLDLGLYRLLNLELPKISYRELFPEIKAADVIKVTDNYSRNYIFINLPEIKRQSALVIGPFLNKMLLPNDVLELSEGLGISPKLSRDLEKYYGSLPVIEQSSHLHALIDALAEYIYGTSNYKALDIAKEYDTNYPNIDLPNSSATPEQTTWNMELMQQRYNFENELMEAVARGQEHKVEMLVSRFTSMQFEKRTQDPIRNTKNYCIIMNTLLRKAAEQGGVHPVYLDKISSEYAIKIETIANNHLAEKLMFEMFHAYCKLVKKHSLKNYSPSVGKIITIVEADLTADLSLNALAATLSVSASYLSTLFKKETGKTLTEYVNGRRIEYAKKLLKTTNLQIQTVAGLCGIDDVHYFSKMFKNIVGVTPKAFRESLN